jgi:hypothetical protein
MKHPKTSRRPHQRACQKKIKTELLTIEQFAGIIGYSVQAVESWLAKGLPHSTATPTGKSGRPRLLFDLVEATNWMVANRIGRSAGLETNDETPVPVVSDEPGLAGAVDRSRSAERLAFRLLRAAIEKHNALEIRATLENWRECAKVLADLEKRHNQYSNLAAEIHEATQQAVRDWAEPKRAFIDAIPSAYASRVNPGNQVQAESILHELKEKLLKQLSEPLTLKNEAPKEKKE